MPTLDNLYPASVWRHFAGLCRIPRPSRHESAVREHLLAWARERGIAARADPIGNLLLNKPATPGMEDRPGVILQGHLDMACQKRDGSPHDFLRDPIAPILEDGWVQARDTTLGADNGIGAALALAALEAPDLSHGPLEVLLTVDEESGMGGARGLESSALAGRLMINLDTEEIGEVYLGCAGGVDVNITHQFATEPAAPGWEAASLALTGLMGGHSGVDIHLERGNAIKLLGRVLADFTPAELRIAALAGGTARNALPRSAHAEVLLAPGLQARLRARLASLEAGLRDELAGVDDDLRLTLTPASRQIHQALSADAQTCLLALLLAAPHGVRRWSQRVPGVVETSNNLGVLQLQEGALTANFMVRSLMPAGSRQLAREISALFSLAGARVETEGEYPGWTPNPDSPLLAHFQATHRRLFGQPATVRVIHAGLECGILADKLPGLDVVSFGPTIRGAHAPGERVNVASVGQAWKLLCALLAHLPPAGQLPAN
ncbi:MAG: aminoacyl-histidine dipeptidase [Rhodocyclaceae bacterium]|jgi:dipeptidase D|nr:aminoacyl-histidine dipeptidase [Rhodocyclaceae bacterium]